MSKRKWKQIEAIEEKRESTIFDLLPEDIMMTYVTQYLKMIDLKNLRLCSRKCKDLVDVMFAGIRSFEFVLRNTSSYYGGTALFLKKTRRLRYLHVDAELTDETFHYVLSHNYLLNAVIIQYCATVTSWALMPLAEYCKNISYLELTYVPISDDFLRALGRHKLTHVVFIIDENDKIKERPSQAALQAFFEKQFIIKDIHLFHTIDLSPIVSTIANSCPNLKYFRLEDCVLSDDKVLIELKRKCRKLRKLDVVINNSYSDEFDEEDSFEEDVEDN